MRTKEKKVSDKICPLPWLHFSAHLDSTMRICCNTDHMGFVYQNDGTTIKLSEVESIDEFFNLKFYKNIRKKMINGEKPEICKKCFQVEDAGGTSVRQGYLMAYKGDEVFQETLENTSVDGRIIPKVRSLDFSLSNNCNLKCIMCNPDASFPIKKDFDALDIPYDASFAEGANKNWKQSDIFKKLIPEVGPDLKEFLTTGGEPFLSKPHKDVLDLLIRDGHAKKIDLSYHTNCTVRNESLFEKWNDFKEIRVHFSIDAYGPLDEYIRFGTKWSKVEENVSLMLKHPKVRSEVHSCVQVLNIFHLTDLYEWISSLDRPMPLLPIHIWMHNPTWLHINILPVELKELAYKRLEKYFQGVKTKDYSFDERSGQILSFLNRSLEENQDTENLELFKERIRKFENLRGQTPIELLVPELKQLFEKKKKFIFF